MSAVKRARMALTQWRHDLRGQALLFGALVAPVIVVMAAFAVDIGAISHQKRQMQGLADLAAIAAAGNIDRAERAVYGVLTDNGFFLDEAEDLEGEDKERLRMKRFENQVSVELGRYTSDEDIAFEARFEVGGVPANAVRVSLREDPERYFAAASDNRDMVTARGTAMVSSRVAMSIGSRLARLQDGLVNEILTELTGSSIELTVMDYNALVDTDIDLFKFSEALASDLSLTAGTYEEVLDSRATFGQVLSAMAQASAGSLRGKTVLQSLASEPSVNALDVDLATLIDFGDAGRFQLGEPPSGLDLALEAVQMLSASAMVANGDRQLDLDLGASVPGLASAKVSLKVGERPQSTTWFSVTDEGDSMVSTAQLRLLIDTKIAPGGVLGGDLVRLPVYLELASAKARVADVICHQQNRSVQRVDIDVKPSIAELRIADVSGGLQSWSETQNLAPAVLLDAKLARVTGYSRTSLSSEAPQTLRFQASQIGGGPKTAATTEPLEGALATAIGSLRLNVDVFGLSLLQPSAVTGAVEDALQGAAQPIDAIVSDLSDLLGISLGEADVWVHSAQCNRSVLVQ